MEKEILEIIENHLKFNVRKVEDFYLLFIQPKTHGGWSVKTFIEKQEYEQEIEKKNISVQGFERLGSAFVKADKDMLHQVVFNLVDNAVKFTEENGSISVYTGENKEGKIYIAIQNSGEGVSSEELGKIFERFYKVDKARGGSETGTGLGTSYNQQFFYFKIDHILCSPTITPYRCRVDNDIKESDHYPIQCK